MKMSDAINLLIDGSKKHGILAKSEEVEIAVDMLINRHDKLVELNKELLESFTDVLTHADFDVYSSEEIQAFERLRIKAKELNQ